MIWWAVCSVLIVSFVLCNNSYPLPPSMILPSTQFETNRREPIYNGEERRSLKWVQSRVRSRVWLTTLASSSSRLVCDPVRHSRKGRWFGYITPTTTSTQQRVSSSSSRHAIRSPQPTFATTKGRSLSTTARSGSSPARETDSR